MPEEMAEPVARDLIPWFLGIAIIIQVQGYPSTTVNGGVDVVALTPHYFNAVALRGSEQRGRCRLTRGRLNRLLITIHGH
jgi:hypothetical protein